MHVTSKPGSKWLDRLRLSKGFPTGNDLDLDHFLSHYQTHKTLINPKSNPIYPNLVENPVPSHSLIQNPVHNNNLIQNPVPNRSLIQNPVPNQNLIQNPVPDRSLIQNPVPNNDSTENSVFNQNLIEYPVPDHSLTEIPVSNQDVIENPIPDQSVTKNPVPNGSLEERGLYNVMSNVLYELFNFGESKHLPAKKTSRKQLNPRICVVGRNREDERKNEEIELLREEKDEDEKGCDDLTGFSRTHVTVIDTSYPWWKCEKVVFRKKNAWRVRDGKGKSTKIGTKKRNAKLVEDESGGSRKKHKELNSPNEGIKQNSKSDKDPEETPDSLRQVQKQRFPRKSKKGSSNSRIKGTLMSKKNGMTPIRVVES